MSENKEHPLIQTYLRDLGYYVSTGYRQSSAMLAPDHWYYETMVWVWSEEKRETDKLVYMTDSTSLPALAYKNHSEIVRKLTSGEPLESSVTDYPAYR